jgi:methyl-accepting chemotaxis protein
MTIIGLIAYFSAESALQNKIGQGFSGLARESMNRIDMTLHERSQNSVAWAALSSMQDIMIDDDDGRIADELKRLKEEYGVYNDIYVANSDGRMIASSSTDLPAENVSEKDWFEKPKSGKFDIRDMYYSELTKKFTMAFSGPIRADYNRNKIIGVLSAQFDWSKIFEMTGSIKVGGERQSESAFVVLLNRDGKIISAPSFMRKKQEWEKINFSILQSVTNAADGNEGYISETVMGREMLVGYASSKGYSSYKGFDWTLLVMMDTERAFAEIEELNVKIISIGLITLLVALCISFIIAARVSGPITKVVRLIDRFAEGDLDVNINYKSEDEVGQLAGGINSMVRKLKTVIQDIQFAANGVQSKSHEMHVIEEISSRISEQTGKATQIATATTEMSQTVAGIADNATKIASYSDETLTIARAGADVVDKTVNEVQEIAKITSRTSDIIISLGDRSSEINAIINVINDVAEQTNLLALNAAIEAARAGENGRGFAVVADEVRKLAERTASATKEISGMIQAIQSEIDKAVDSMQHSQQRVESGVCLSHEAGDSLGKIVNSVGELQANVQSIAAATDQMSKVAEQISTDIETVGSVADENIQVTGQIRESSSDLARLSTDLQVVLKHFEVKE